MTSAEQQHTADRSPTERLIRDLYSVVAFYTANPDHPLPAYITMGSRVADAAEVQAVADRWSDGRVYGNQHEQCDHRLNDTSVDVTFIISARTPDRPL